MANSLDSNEGVAAEIHRSVVYTTCVAPSNGKLQSSKGSGGFDPGDTVDAFDIPGNDNKQGIVRETGAHDAVSADIPKMSAAEVEEQATAKNQEQQVQCSKKCALEIQVIDDAALMDPSLVGNEKFNNEEKNGAKRNGKQQEIGEKKEKKHKRRGGKGSGNKDVLNCYFSEKKEKKGLQYSRREMEALRFEELEEQKKKWIEVYCGLGLMVAQEYDELVEVNKIHQKHSVPSFDFDPRPQFLKSADLGEDCLQFAEYHLEILNTSDPASFLPVSDEIGCSVVEEECSQNHDSDDDYTSIQKPAFLVTGEPDFDSGPPQDGLEFLRRVRWEAARIPKVKIVKVNKIKEQSQYMPQIPDIMKCPENLLPLRQWEDSFLADFSELRLVFMRLYDLQGSSAESSTKLQPVDEENILSQMLENNAFENFVSSTSIDDSCPSDTKLNPNSTENSGSIIDPPTLSTILKMDSATRTSMLKRRISSIENMSRLTHNDSLWLFALCAAVDCPLDADTSAALRSLLRKCASLRAAKTEVDNEVFVLNILVTISGRYFGQLEK